MKNAISSKKNNSNTPTIEPAITAVWFEDLLFLSSVARAINIVETTYLIAEDPSFEDLFEVKGGIKPVLVEGRTTVFVEVNPLPANLGTPELLFNGAGILFPGDTDVLLPRETGVLVGAGVEAPDDESELFTTALTRGFLLINSQLLLPTVQFVLTSWKFQKEMGLKMN